MFIYFLIDFLRIISLLSQKIQPPTVPEKGPSNPTNVQYRSFHTESPASKPLASEAAKEVDSKAESIPIGEYFDKLQAGASAKKPRRKVVEEAEREQMDFGDCGHPPNMMQGFAGMGSH